MRKTSVILFTILVFTIQAFSQDTGIHFTYNLSWKEVKAKAKRENKLIFIDVYATWCGPCKIMDAQVYPTKAVGNIMNEKFVSIKVQHDQTKNDTNYIKNWYTDAKSITQKYKIESLPSFLFFSPDGILVHRSTGYQDSAAFIKQAKIALKNPIKKLNQNLAAFKKGKRDSAFLHDLAILALEEGDQQNTSFVANEYIKGLKNPYTKENLNFIIQFTKKSADPGFTFLSKHSVRVNQLLGPNTAEDKLMGVIHQQELSPFDKIDNPDWNTIEKNVVSKFGALGEERVWGVMTVYYLNKQDWNNFGKYYKLYFDRAIENKRSFLHMNNMSWPIVEHISDLPVLETAVKTMAYTIENFDSNNPYSMDTYANLLYKSGRKEEAIKVEQKAVELSNKNKELVETLNKMQRGEIIWK